MPNIPDVCARLGAPATRVHPDGSPYHTLPAIQNVSTGAVVGDTFEIVQYLDREFPDTPKLLLPGTLGLTAAFNAHIDGLFTKFITLCDYMPARPAQKVAAIFAGRAKAMGVEVAPMSTSEREEKLAAFEAALGELAKAYRHTGGTTDYFWSATGTPAELAQRGKEGVVGPWLEGDRPVYADVIVGAWLMFVSICMRKEEWERLRTWHGQLWGRIVDALQPWSEVS